MHVLSVVEKTVSVADFKKEFVKLHDEIWKLNDLIELYTEID